MKFKITLLAFSLLFSATSINAAKFTIRIGVLTFGTANWELSALDNEKLLKDADFDLEIVPMANPQAGKIALQSNAVDIIISDWIWVSSMRNKGNDYTFYPYSNTAGALMVPTDSNILTVTDLKGKRLGIAGGELDKNWLLLRMLGTRKNIDLADQTTQVYGAPPLLNQQLKQHRIDAVINYWHFAARLEALGYKQIINGSEILRQLGINEEIPSLGYVFRANWAQQHKTELRSFLHKTSAAKDQLCNSALAWQKITALTKADSPDTEQKLRQRYCEGRVKHWGASNQKAAQQVFQWLAELSGNKLTGETDQLQPGTFWQLD
jgi:NitT/TauT family transport system substrate-binding protein